VKRGENAQAVFLALVKLLNQVTETILQSGFLRVSIKTAKTTKGGKGKKKGNKTARQGEKEGKTNLKFLVGDILVSIEAVLGEVEIALEATVTLAQLVIKLVAELLDYRLILEGLPVGVWLPEHVIDASLSKFLQCGLEGKGDGLVSGLEVALALISSLYTRVGEVLYSPPARATSTTRSSSRFRQGGIGSTSASSATSTTAASPASATATG
jgi:hypothetical protein